jgi:hypothetical protein
MAIICAAGLLFDLPDWARLVILLAGILFLAVCIVTAGYLLVYQTADAIRSLGMARVDPPILLANALRGLSGMALDIVERHDSVKILALIQEGGRPVWAVRTGAMDIPYPFVKKFFEESAQTAPHLYPVSDAYDLKDDSGQPWPNAERLAEALTNYLISNGWAEQAVGRSSARITQPIRVIARRFDVVLE